MTNRSLKWEIMLQHVGFLSWIETDQGPSKRFLFIYTITMLINLCDKAIVLQSSRPQRNCASFKPSSCSLKGGRGALHLSGDIHTPKLEPDDLKLANLRSSLNWAKIMNLETSASHVYKLYQDTTANFDEQSEGKHQPTKSLISFL